MERLKKIIEENRKKILIILGILIVLTGGITYAYYSVGDKQEGYNTIISGCLSITITEESDAINLDRVKPVTIEEGLNNEPYTFTIKNNCSESAPYQVSLESIDKVETTMGIENIHVSLEDVNGRRITERLDRLEETLISNENAYDARKIYNGALEGKEETSFKFRMWLDYDATKESAANKTYKSKIVISAKDNINKDDEIIKIRYEELESEKWNNEWYKSYITKVTITDRKDEQIKAKYCVGTEKCEPNKEVEVENNSFEYEYENGINILCTEASDSKGNRSEVVCNSIIKVDSTTPATSVSVASSTVGSNGWYKALSLKVEGTNNISGISSIKYCTTTESTCTPTNSVEGNNVTVLLNTNASAQRVCAQTTDNKGTASSVQCSEEYKVDEADPIVSVEVASSTAGSNSWYKALSIKGTASDTGSGVASIKYCTTTSSTCTPTTAIANGGTVALSSNASAQKVCYQVTDNAGRTSSVTCSNTYKVDTSTTTASVSVASSTAGSNGWYKALSLKVQGTNSYSGISNVKYCTTTGTTCTPATAITNGGTVTLSSNASAQKVCVQATDNKGTSSTVVCSSAYSVDNTVPTVSITSSNSTSNSITVNISGNDAHSNISTYYYKIGSGSYTSDTSTTKTFIGLNAGTTYTVSVYAVDIAGNQSTVASKSVATQNVIEQIKLSANSGTPDFSKTAQASCSDTSKCETTNGVYKAQDNDGDSFYFRGAVTNNYVKFAGFYWRIIRINGDGTIRMIYDGTSAHANGTSTTDSIVAIQKFNANKNNNAYVGFRYVLGEVHGLGAKSKALEQLETWYTNNLASYASKIDINAGFCGDRTFTPIYGGTGTTLTYYGGYTRLMTSKTPVLTCGDASDLYTINSSNKGNKSLTYPIGLIIADEVSMAGGLYGAVNQNYYLYNGQSYWTLSPTQFQGSSVDTFSASVFYVLSSGYLTATSANLANGIRPVINLKADTIFTGSGTMTDPYVVN